MGTDKACCFFGHRKIDETPELIERLTREIEALITEKAVNIFYFGSKSEFDDLCHKTVTELKEKYPHIKRVYVRSAFQHILDWYEDSLLKHYEKTYFACPIRVIAFTSPSATLIFEYCHCFHLQKKNYKVLIKVKVFGADKNRTKTVQKHYKNTLILQLLQR